VTDIAGIGFAVDTSGLDQGAQALDRFGQKVKGVVEPTGAMQAAAQRAGVSVEEFRKRVANVQGNLDQYEKGLVKTVTATQRVADQTKSASKELENAGGAVDRHRKQVDDAGKAHQRGAVNISEFRAALRVMGREAALIGGPLGELIRTASTLSLGMARLHPVVLLVTLAIAGMTAGVLLSIKAWAALEEQQAKVQNALNATKNASGQTTEGLTTMARQLAASGTVAIDKVREAQLELLKYKEVSGDTFEFILKKAKDVAATGFADLATATKAIAEAFKDPTQAYEKLTEVGLKLSVAEQRLATDLFNSGRLLESRRVIQDALSKQMNGADANAANTLQGAWNRLTRAGGELLEVWGKEIAEATNLKNVLNDVARAASAAAKAKRDYQETPSGGATGQVAMGSMGITQRLINTLIPADMRGGKTAPTGPVAFPRFDDSVTQIAVQSKESAARTEALRKQKQEEEELKKRIDATVDSLNVEARTSGLNATQQRIFNEQLKAGVLQMDQFGNVSVNNSEKAKAVNKAVVNVETLRFMEQLRAGFIQQKGAIDAETDTVGKGVQEASAYRFQQEKINQAKAQGLPVSAALRKQINDEATAIGAANAALERRKILSDIDFQNKTIGLSDRDLEIATKLRTLYGNDVPRALASTEAAAMRASMVMKDMVSVAKTGAEQFTTDLVTGLLDGKNAVDTLHDAFNNLSKSMASSAVKDLMSGNFEKAALEAVVAIGAKLASNFFDNSDQKKLDEAKKAWADMRDTVSDFMAKAAGGTGNNLSATLRGIAKDFTVLAKAAADAHDFGALVQLVQATVAEFARLSNDFKASFEGTLQAMKDGSGPDGPFASGQKRIQELTAQIKDFVQDTTTVFSGALTEAWHLGFIPTSGTLDASQQIAMAQEAGRTLLLTQVSGVQALSDVASALSEMNGKTVGLQQALMDLGLTADAATAAIANARSQGIAKIAADFVDGLNRQLNEAMGRGFVNQIADLIKSTEQRRADAALLPGGLAQNQSLIDKLFAAQAQQIVDQAGLVGDSFNDLIKLFPSLTGQVHESTAALQQQTDAQVALQRALDSAAKNILEYINGINTGTESALSPTARLAQAQTSYNAKLVLASAGNQDALQSITQDAEALRQALRDVYGSTAAFQSGWQTIQTQLLGLPAVQQSEDPSVVLQREILTASNSTATNTGAQGILKAAIDTGSAAAVATALSTYFNNIDTNLDDNISSAEMVTALHGMASDASLAAMFKTLDIDNSGSLTKLDLINTATGNTNTGVGQVKAVTETMRDATNTIKDVGYRDAGSTTWVAKDALLAIKDIDALLSAQLTGYTNTVPVTTSAGTFVTYGGKDYTHPPGDVQNNMLTALNKIVINTWATANNTAFESGIPSQMASAKFGTYEFGGLLRAGQYGIFGEHHPQGPWIMQAGDADIPISPSMPPAFGGGDNEEIAQALFHLAEAMRNVGGDVRAGAEHVREGVDAVKRSHDELVRTASLPRF
jgi:hypothetical protein